MSYAESEHSGRSATRWSPAEPCECGECMSAYCDVCGKRVGVIGEEDFNTYYFEIGGRVIERHSCDGECLAVTWDESGPLFFDEKLADPVPMPAGSVTPTEVTQ